MEDVGIPATAIVEYILITWLPWLVGVAVGAGLSVLCARGIRAFLSTRPVLRYPLVLLPWRTLVMGFLMAAWSPYILVFFGLGPIAGGIMVGSPVCILAMAFTATTLMEDWYPSPLRVRLIGGARTLVVASCLIAAGAGHFGGGGLGHFLWLGFALSERIVLWQGVLVVIATALVLDLALGLVQLIVLKRSGDDGEPGAAEGVAA